MLASTAKKRATTTTAGTIRICWSGVGSSLTYDEYVSHFSLWCQMASPLILGNDLRTLDEHPEILDIITNEDAIAVDQDPTASRASATAMKAISSTL